MAHTNELNFKLVLVYRTVWMSVWSWLVFFLCLHVGFSMIATWNYISSDPTFESASVRAEKKYHHFEPACIMELLKLEAWRTVEVLLKFVGGLVLVLVVAVRLEKTLLVTTSTIDRRLPVCYYCELHHRPSSGAVRLGILDLVTR